MRQLWMNTVFIYINGILNFPGDAQGWTDRAVTWTHVNTGHKAEKFEYFAGALTRRFQADWWAAELARLMACYKGYCIELVGHSNGCDLIVRALQKTPQDVFQCHLLSPACEADFSKNGLNYAIEENRVAGVTVYMAGQDKAMTWAKVSQAAFGWLGLGYGTLGLQGPVNVSSGARPCVREYVEPGYGHSDWFGEDFGRTMQIVTGGRA